VKLVLQSCLLLLLCLGLGLGLLLLLLLLLDQIMLRSIAVFADAAEGGHCYYVFVQPVRPVCVCLFLAARVAAFGFLCDNKGTGQSGKTKRKCANRNCNCGCNAPIDPKKKVLKNKRQDQIQDATLSSLATSAASFR
jgi:hypothetical protein